MSVVANQKLQEAIDKLLRVLCESETPNLPVGELTIEEDERGEGR